MTDYLIPGAFILLVCLNLWFIIGSKGQVIFKTFTILFSVTFVVCVWTALEHYYGWPTKDKLPDDFQIVWMGVKEPNKYTGDNGAIFIWVEDLNTANERDFPASLLPHPNEPRLYKFDYTRKRHDITDELMAMIKKDKKLRAFRKKNGNGQDNGKHRGGNGRMKHGGSIPDKNANKSNDGFPFDIFNQFMQEDPQGRQGGFYLGQGKPESFDLYELPAPRIPNKPR